MLAGAFIVVAYAALIWEFGGWGVAAAAAHLLVMLVAVPRR